MLVITKFAAITTENPCTPLRHIALVEDDDREIFKAIDLDEFEKIMHGEDLVESLTNGDGDLLCMIIDAAEAGDDQIRVDGIDFRVEVEEDHSLKLFPLQKQSE